MKTRICRRILSTKDSASSGVGLLPPYWVLNKFDQWNAACTVPQIRALLNAQIGYLSNKKQSTDRYLLPRG